MTSLPVHGCVGGAGATIPGPAHLEGRVLSDRCKRGHEWTPENTYTTPAGARQCRQCVALRSRKYEAAHRDRVRERRASYRIENAEELRAKDAAYNAANRDKSRAYAAASYAANPGKARERYRAWRAANPEKARDSYHRWRAGSGAPADPETVAYLGIIATDPCAYCGAPSTEDDHIVAMGNDGGHHWTNLTRACMRCNRRKRNRPLLHWLRIYAIEGAA